MKAPQVRELQVTPMPDTIDAPGFGFLPLAAGASWVGGRLAGLWRWLAAAAL